MLRHHHLMKIPKIIQGGMGVAISDWKLAKAVSKQGQLGVVSGTGISHIFVARLMDGDIGGHIQRALKAFPFQDATAKILKKYYVPNPKKPKSPYKRPPMWTMKPSKVLNQLTVIANFVEVYLAKEGHKNSVGINLLEKVQMPTMASLYGAMLAGVNHVIMGAGIPTQIPGILDDLTNHKKVSYRLDVNGGSSEQLHFNPQQLFPNVLEKVGRLTRPFFSPIVSSVVLAKSLIKRSTGKINGLVVEMPVAGGHNAPPRGKLQLDDKKEPLYGPRDEVDLTKIKELNLPFWLAGGYDTPEKLTEAVEAGAAGIQVGTAFALCDESGLEDTLKKKILKRVENEDAEIYTDPFISPTGFPFKVVQLEGTMSDPLVYKKRTRLCEIGMLRTPFKNEDGKIEFRCSAEPEDQYIAKGGTYEDTVGKSCLCNNLNATAGYPQHRKDGYIEAPLVTAGNGLEAIGRLFKARQTTHSFTAKDVLTYITA
ncbi:MAG: nitronate monooxygenase [Chloroflexota bacterium]